MDEINHVQRLVVRSDGETVPKISFTKDRFSKLHTFISENAAFHIILSDFRCLCILKLFGSGIIELSDSIGQLIQLRFLHISHAEVEKLPKSITKLYNLQTLRIENCFSLKKLPEDLRNLINLRHICMDHDDIKQTPKDIRQLTCLQTLSFFVVGQNIGHQIEELRHLNQLRGKLDIYHLENVRNKKEARSANLAKNAKIYKLGFYWSLETGVDHHNDEKVLEGLQPHRYLKSLTIYGFRGGKFPSWMLTGCGAGDGLSLFDNLIHINLNNCSKCEEVPILGHLPCLRFLKMEGMNSVKVIGTEFYGDGRYRNAFFPVLRRLELRYMGNLVEWKDALESATPSEVFPCLEELTIHKCGQLRSAPCHFPSLKKLVISIICAKAFINISSKLTTLTSLNVYDVLELTSLSGKLLQNNTSLMSLKILSCPNLVSISSQQDVSWAFCNSLRSLHISSCGVKFLPPSLQSCTSLKELFISNCPNLRSIPDLRELYFLTKLEIVDCPELVSFVTIIGAVSLQRLVMSSCGVGILPFGLQSCTSLQELIIEKCHNLISTPDLRGLNSLTELIISNCPRLSYFQSIQGATSLQRLVMSSCDVEVQPIGLQSCKLLSELRITECPNLQSIPDLRVLHSLKKLEILDCLILESIQGLRELQSFTELAIVCCPSLISIQDLRELPSLQFLMISSCGIEVLPVGLQSCMSLITLIIVECPNLTSIPNLRALHSLAVLHIWDCHDLRSIPDLRELISLTELKINGGRCLRCLPEGLLDFLTHLKTLKIGGYCEELDAFPSLINSTSINTPLKNSHYMGGLNSTLSLTKFNVSLLLKSCG